METSVLEKIKTREDRDIFVSEIDILLSGLYENKGEGFESSLKANVRAWVANRILVDLPSGITERESYLTKLKEKADKMNILTLTLAYEPSYTSIESISNFVKRECGKETIVDIQYNPQIIAGAKIIYNGKYKDFSLLTRFQEVMEALSKDFKGA